MYLPKMRTRSMPVVVDLTGIDDEDDSDSDAALSDQQQQQQQHPEQHQPCHGAIQALLAVRSKEDVIEELTELALNKDHASLRALLRSAALIQEAVRQVEADHSLEWWLPLRCHCHSYVRWTVGPTSCTGDRALRGCCHKLHIQRLRCSHCTTTWDLATSNPGQARREGSWHPLLNKHCPNTSCSHAPGGTSFKCAEAPPISKAGPVLLR
jgi:hypothetical protein